MALDLNKKIGPLPLWSYMAIGGLGVIWFIRSRSAAANTSATDASTAIDPSTGQSYASELAAAQAGSIDPTTGLPYAQEGSGAGGDGSTIASSSAPSLSQELADVEAAFPGIATYLGSGGSPTNPTGTPSGPGGGLITVPPGTTVYDPTTGTLLTAPPAAGAAPPAPSPAPSDTSSQPLPQSPYVPTPAPAPSPPVVFQGVTLPTGVIPPTAIGKPTTAKGQPKITTKDRKAFE